MNNDFNVKMTLTSDKISWTERWNDCVMCQRIYVDKNACNRKTTNVERQNKELAVNKTAVGDR